jgi:hypothetical protein
MRLPSLAAGSYARNAKRAGFCQPFPAAQPAARAQAEDRNPLNATAILDMGGFFLSTDVRVRFDGQGTVMASDPIDFEDTFGSDHFERFRFDGLWRIEGRHSIRGTYFSCDRSRTRPASSGRLLRDSA